jgi:ribonuclease HI
MLYSAPHYFLTCEAASEPAGGPHAPSLARPANFLTSEAASEPAGGRWSFVLEPADGGERIAAADLEPHTRGERLELLAVVRALEALDQPSRVTIRAASPYVRRGIAYGLEEWRANGWTWEHYGQMVQVKHHDLWQRLDRALAIHEVQQGQRRIDPAHGGDAKAGSTKTFGAPIRRSPVPRPHFLRDKVQRARRLLTGGATTPAAASV